MINTPSGTDPQFRTAPLKWKPPCRLDQPRILSKDSKKSDCKYPPSCLPSMCWESWKPQDTHSKYQIVFPSLPPKNMALSSLEHSLPFPVLRPVSVSAVITHSQDITGSLQYSLKLFPDKMPVDAPSDYKKQRRHHAQAVEMCRSCTAHTRHCTWAGLIPAGVDKASTFW